ncbi:MAG: TatD family hydrolase [Alphaproteobacteria bacterium]
MLVDSHCHLNFPDFKDDLASVISRAQQAGVGVMQTICTKMSEFDEVHRIAQANDNIYCSVGVHPNNTSNTEIVSVQTLVDSCSSKKVIGLGETGLDYHYDNSDPATQKASFRNHIEAARQTGIPLIVHTRDADEDTVNILKEEMAKGAFKGLIHCFTSTKYLADEAVKCGFYISLSGIITFKNAQAIRDALVDVPLERILVETDAPYLAPAPNRGKRNEPSYVVHTNKALSEIKGISEEECARITTANFFTLFSKASAPGGA